MVGADAARDGADAAEGDAPEAAFDIELRLAVEDPAGGFEFTGIRHDAALEHEPETHAGGELFGTFEAEAGAVVDARFHHERSG